MTPETGKQKAQNPESARIKHEKTGCQQKYRQLTHAEGQEVALYNGCFYENLKETRLSYGISQSRLAVESGITRQYLNKLENGKAAPSEKLQEILFQTLERFNPDNPLEILFDYVRIRFPTTNIKWLVEGMLRLKMKYMLHEDHAFYGYTDQYILGDITVMTSPEEEKGILLELKGRGCRQIETYFSSQGRTWYEFLREAVSVNGHMKRIDLAINDRFGLLHIPELIKKCANEECVSVFRSFKNYRSGDLVRTHEQYKLEMGNTLYIGSLKSEVYFCVYEKDYEQYKKAGTPLEEADVKNRFEIRLKEERAELAVKDLLHHEDAGRTAFGIINRYMRIVDREEGKRRSKWKMNKDWGWFVGQEERKLKLTTKPEPYTFERTMNWLSHQVAPTLKVVMKLDRINGTDRVNEMVEHARLTERHEKILEQQAAEICDLVC